MHQPRDPFFLSGGLLSLTSPDVGFFAAGERANGASHSLGPSSSSGAWLAFIVSSLQAKKRLQWIHMQGDLPCHAAIASTGNAPEFATRMRSTRNRKSTGTSRSTSRVKTKRTKTERTATKRTKTKRTKRRRAKGRGRRSETARMESHQVTLKETASNDPALRHGCLLCLD